MARAIHKIADAAPLKEEAEAKLQETLKNALTENTDALAEVLKLVQLLHRAEFLQMANALLEQGTPILEIIVNQAKKPEYAGGLKNGLGLLQLLGKLDVGVLNRALDAVERAEERVQSGEAIEAGGVFKLLGALRDPDVTRGLSFMLEVLRGIGSGLRGE